MNKLVLRKLKKNQFKIYWIDFLAALWVDVSNFELMYQILNRCLKSWPNFRGQTDYWWMNLYDELSSWTKNIILFSASSCVAVYSWLSGDPWGAWLAPVSLPGNTDIPASCVSELSIRYTVTGKETVRSDNMIIYSN